MAIATTRAARFFTMVNMDQDQNARGANQDIVTELVIPSPQGSIFLPGNQGSAWVPGRIAAAIMGPTPESQNWDSAPLVNNAILNQSSLFASMGSITIHSNLSRNLQSIYAQVVEASIETADRDPILMTKELEKAICESVIRSSTREEFAEAVQESSRDVAISMDLLGEVYDELQFAATAFREGSIPAPDDLIDWEAIANATTPRTQPDRIGPETQDPIQATNIVINTLPRTPNIVLGVETSQQIQGAILVNNLIIPQAAFQRDFSGEASRSSMTGYGP